MANESDPQSTASRSLRGNQVGLMAGVFLLLGLSIGYVIPASQPAASVFQGGIQPAERSPAGNAMGARMPGAAEIRHMADQQAAPLLAQLKSDPANIALLTRVGAIYHISQQFGEAASYYDKALQVDPRNVPIRTRLASSLFRGGDVDGAIAQLNVALSYDPKDANALYDLGVIRLEGKGDGRGAVAVWQELLKANPNLSRDRKAAVLEQIAHVRSAMGNEYRMEKAAR